MSLYRALSRNVPSSYTKIFLASRRTIISQISRPISRKQLVWSSAILLSLAFGNQIYMDANVQQDTDGGDTTVDPASGMEFPNAIRVGSRSQTGMLSLIGVGIRKVSFLGIKVYSVGFYADMSNPSLKLIDSMTPDEKIEHIIQNTACAIRILPTRQTNYTHLRDAFVRALGERLVKAVKAQSITEEETIQVASAINKLKTLFPNTAMKKGQLLDIYILEPVLGKPRTLFVRDLGSVQEEFAAKQFMLHYFEGDGPSPPMKTMVVEKLNRL